MSLCLRIAVCLPFQEPREFANTKLIWLQTLDVDRLVDKYSILLHTNFNYTPIILLSRKDRWS